jgi:hypothetical protein
MKEWRVSGTIAAYTNILAIYIIIRCKEVERQELCLKERNRISLVFHYQDIKNRLYGVRKSTLDVIPETKEMEKL